MEKVTAVCPAALSFIFKSFLPEKEITGGNYSGFGSTGMGCTVDKSVTVVASKSDENSITFNSIKTNLPTVGRAVSQIYKGKSAISIISPLPLGSGFGISGASALGAVHCVNKLFNLNIPPSKLAIAAHNGEIIEKTGLGTVATQITGGFLIKSRPGVPPRYKRLPFTGKKIYAVILGKLKTEKVLTDKNKLNIINPAAGTALNEITSMKNPSLEDTIKCAYEFYRESRIFEIPKGRRIIFDIYKKGGAATMAMIGKVILSTIRPENTKFKIYELTVSEERVRIT